MTSSPERVADALLAARRACRPVAAAEYESALHGAEDAYAVQRLVAAGLGEPGLRYWKSGGPLRTSALTHAALPARGILPSPADAHALHFNMRLIEAEIALRLDAGAQPQAMAVSIEIVDSRWRERVQAPALLRLADLQSHGALVLGEWVAYEARDWTRQRCEVRIGSNAHEFTGTHSLEDPTWLLPQWLAHAQRQGLRDVEGTIVTTGTWCGMLPAGSSDFVHVRFPGIGEASVQL